MIDISHNPRISQLLGRVEETRRALAALPPAAPQREHFVRQLHGFQREVGEYVHWLMRQDPQTQARIEAEGRRWAQERDREEVDARSYGTLPSEGWEASLDGVDGPTSDEASLVELHSDSQHGAVDRKDLTDPEPLALDAMELLPEVELEPIALDEAPAEEEDQASAGAVRGRVERVGAGLLREVAEAAAAPESHAWMDALQDVLGVVGPLDEATLDEAACQVAANRLMNATTSMEVRWMGFPDTVQHALVGLIGCRARRLQRVMAVDIDLRLTLGRLRRFHEARGLPPASCLRDHGRPERGDWGADARHWWSVLHTGG